MDCIFTACLLVITLVCITIAMELISLVFYTKNRKNLRDENVKLKKENEALKECQKLPIHNINNNTCDEIFDQASKIDVDNDIQHFIK